MMTEDSRTRYNDFKANWINEMQTPDERRKKYAILKSAGINSQWSRTLRDIRWTAILRHWPQVVQYLDNNPSIRNGVLHHRSRRP